MMMGMAVVKTNAEYNGLNGEFPRLRLRKSSPKSAPTSP